MDIKVLYQKLSKDFIKRPFRIFLAYHINDGKNETHIIKG